MSRDLGRGVARGAGEAGSPTPLPVGLYFALSEASRWRATWGKRRLGLVVLGPGGAPAPMHLALLALVWTLVGANVVGIKVGRRAVYDVVVGTWVVRGGARG